MRRLLPFVLLSAAGCGAGIIQPDQCPPGTVSCNEACCAVCYHDSHCAPDEACDAGMCLPTDANPDLCPDGEACTPCPNECEAPDVDRCEDGLCVCGTATPCEAGRTCCDGTCVDLLDDPDHCGACDERCDASCIGGACVDDKDPCAPLAACPGADGGTECVDVTSDVSHCGFCGHDCSLLWGDRVDSCSADRCGCAANDGVPCESDETCEDSGCVPLPCDIDTCPSGCCDSNACHELDSRHCGLPGESCFDCTTLGDRADSCSDGGECICGPAGRMCDEGETCTLAGCGATTLLYKTASAHDGDFGGRSGVNQFCAQELPDGLSCTTVRAFVSVSPADEVRSLADAAGYVGPVSWLDRETLVTTHAADDWQALFDSLATSHGAGTGDASAVWTGSNNDGSYAAEGTTAEGTCNGWTHDTNNTIYMARGSRSSLTSNWVASSWSLCNETAKLLCACSAEACRDADEDGFSTCGGDCDDQDPLVSPGEEADICGDGRDNNCDGVADEGCAQPDDDAAPPVVTHIEVSQRITPDVVTVEWRVADDVELSSVQLRRAVYDEIDCMGGVMRGCEWQLVGSPQPVSGTSGSSDQSPNERLTDTPGPGHYYYGLEVVDASQKVGHEPEPFGQIGVLVATNTRVFFVDNTVSGGAGNGSSWANAFDSLQAAIWDCGTQPCQRRVQPGDVFYVKATTEPYRYRLSTLDYANTSGHIFYFDATGVGHQRGDNKARIWGSLPLDETWAAHSGLPDAFRASGFDIDAYLSYADEPDVEYAAGLRTHFRAQADDGQLGLYWLAGGDENIVRLRRATGLDDLGYGSYYLQPATGELYVRLAPGVGADTADLEISRFHIMAEAWTASPPGMILVGGQVQLGGWAHANGGCHGWLFDGMDFSHNQRGVFISSAKGELRGCAIHHNGEYGVDQAPGGRLRIVNSLIHDNDGPGVNHPSLNPIELIHNTIVDNAGHGVSVQSTFQPSANLIANNIIFGHTRDLFVIESSSEGYRLDSRSNYYGTSGGYWQSGSTDIVSSAPPALTGDFSPTASSPCRDAGEPIVDPQVLGVWVDAAGADRPSESVDIGALEF